MFHWHKKHQDEMTIGARLADSVASGMGSWAFIIAQTLAIITWVTYNMITGEKSFDPFPFILLNLVFSVQAAYAAPIIMQAQNRQSERDRHQADADYETNVAAKNEIEELAKHLSRLEVEKLDQIITLLTALTAKQG